MTDPIRQAHDKLMQQASEQGKLLEAGFIALQAVALQSASPRSQAGCGGALT